MALDLDNLVLSPKQVELLAWFHRPERERWLILAGSVRSGKTFALNLGWLQWTHGHWNRPTDFMIAGHSVGSVRRNVLEEMSEFAQGMGISWNYRFQGSYVQCGIHKYHVFGADDADSSDKIRGMTVGGIYFDEMTLLDPDFIQMAISRASLPGFKYVASTNPDIPMHPIKTDFIDKIGLPVEQDGKKGKYYEMRFDDNPTLTQEYLDSIRTIYKGANLQRYYYGKWVADSGLVYPEFHLTERVEYTPYTRVTLALDYATTSITFAILCFLDTRTQRAVIVDEWVHDVSDYTKAASGAYADDELARKLIEFIEAQDITRDTCEILPDPVAASFKRVARNEGWMVREANNDRLEGARVTNIALSNKYIMIHPRCKRLIKELGTYVWDEKKAEKGVDDMKDTKIHHGVDALRYYAMYHFKWLYSSIIRVPKELRI